MVEQVTYKPGLGVGGHHALRLLQAQDQVGEISLTAQDLGAEMQPEHGPLPVPDPVFHPETPWHVRQMPGGKLWDMWEDRALTKKEQEALGRGELRGPDISTKGEEQREELMKRIKPLLTPAQLAQLEEEKKRLKEPVGRPEDRYIPEREIPKPSDLSVRDMPVSKDGGLKNIMNVLALARPDEIEYWRHWYVHAGQDAQALADKYGVPRNVSAAVIALLSPNTKWEDNVFAAEQILRGQGRKVIDYRKKLDQESQENLAAAIYPSLYTSKETLGASSYLVNIQKAQRVLDAWEEAGEPSNFPIDQGPPVPVSWDPKDAAQTAAAEAQYARARQRGWNTFYAKQEFAPNPTNLDVWKQTVGAGNIYDRQEAYETLMKKRRVPPDEWYKPGKMKRTWDAQGRMDRFDPTTGRAILVPPMKLHAQPKKEGGEQKSTPKVTAFYRSIEEPEKHQNEVVLDGHAINIWRGEPRPLDDLADASPPTELREQMIADYKEAAARATKLLAQKGVKLDQPLTPQQVQAITWSVWRNAVQPKKRSASEREAAGIGDGWGAVDYALMHLTADEAILRRTIRPPPGDEPPAEGPDYARWTFPNRKPHETPELRDHINDLRDITVHREHRDVNVMDPTADVEIGEIDLTGDEAVHRTTLESGPGGHPSHYWPDYAKRTMPQNPPMEEQELRSTMRKRKRQLERGTPPAKQHFTGEIDLSDVLHATAAEHLCAECGQPVGEDSFGADGRYFHRACLDARSSRHDATQALSPARPADGPYELTVQRAGKLWWHDRECSLELVAAAASAYGVSAPEEERGARGVLVARTPLYELRVANADEACAGVLAEAALRTQAWRRVVTCMLHPKLPFLKDAATMNDIVPHAEFIAPADMQTTFGFSVPQGETLYFEGFHRPADDQFYGFQDLGAPGESPTDNLRLRFLTPDHQLVVLSPRDLEPLEAASGALGLGEVPTNEMPGESIQPREPRPLPEQSDEWVVPRPLVEEHQPTVRQRDPTALEPGGEDTIDQFAPTRRRPIPRQGPQPIPPAEPGTQGDWDFLQMPHGWSPEYIPGATQQTRAPQQTVPARPMPRAPTMPQSMSPEQRQEPTVPGRPAPYAAGKQYEAVLAFTTAGGDTVEWSGDGDVTGLRGVASQFGIVAANVTDLGSGWLEFAGRPHLGPFGSGRHVLRVRAGADGLRLAARLGGA